MTLDVNTYLAHLDDKKGKLERWETDIFRLHLAGVSYQKIADFLKMNGVQTIKMDVYRFIHRKKRKHLLSGHSDIPIETITSRTDVAPKKEAPQVSENVKTTEHDETPSRPKFKFRESVGKEKTKW